MALSKKISKAVKDAQRQANTAVADVRDTLDRRLPEVEIDPTPFYAVVGAANMAVDTVRAAGEQLDAARRQAAHLELRKGAKKEAKDLQKLVGDLQHKTAELQRLAGKYAERLLTQAQELPVALLNQSLLVASNAKDQYDAAAARGEKVVTDLRVQEEKAAADLNERSEAVMARGRNLATAAAREAEKLAGTAFDVVADDAATLGSQVSRSAQKVEDAAAPVEAERSPEDQARLRSLSAQQAAATRKANDTQARTTRKVAARSSARKRSAAAGEGEGESTSAPRKRSTGRGSAASTPTAGKSTARKSTARKSAASASKAAQSAGTGARKSAQSAEASAGGAGTTKRASKRAGTRSTAKKSAPATTPRTSAAGSSGDSRPSASSSTGTSKTGAASTSAASSSGDSQASDS